MIRTAILQLSRLTLNAPGQPLRCISTQNGPLAFHATSMLNAEPMKKKKKQDAGVLIAREQKKRRNIEKQIRKMNKSGRKLKPIEEIEGDRKLKKELDLRRRMPEALTFEESERRALLMKEWTRYKAQQYKAECVAVAIALNAQQVALQELREESEELYQLAIQPMDSLIPFEREGPRNTPAISKYESPDGDYIDTTKTFR